MDDLPLWQPSAAMQQAAALRHYLGWLAGRGQLFADYQQLWRWSVTDIEAFWQSIWEYFAIQSTHPYQQVLNQRQMPGGRWFEGAQINYVDQVLRMATSAHPAIISAGELRPTTECSWETLLRRVAACAAGLRQLGVGVGDRVVAYLPNIEEAVIAFLATASLGAIWSSCSPDMGEASVADRFSQIEPKVLFTVDGYRYAGKDLDRREVVRQIRRHLPSLQQTVLVPYLDPHAKLEASVSWEQLLADTQAVLQPTPVPFDHPLWILYSSGTTGLPKPIVQSQGGIVLEHLKSLRLHLDLGVGDRFFWFTTTGWMMWNFLVGGLLVGNTILLFDGSPGYPTLGRLWQFAADTKMQFFGTSAAYLQACIKAELHPGRDYDLHALRALGSTGSPLSSEGFDWIYQTIKSDLWLASVSGGTDVCTAFVGGCPLLPVYRGQIQCRCLGASVEAFDEAGQPVYDQVGELVVTQPMPSMPIFFWNDAQQQRYRESYFEYYPGIWRHGDWVRITPQQGVVIYGRSDSTINRQGVRMGTSELYRVVEALPEVVDSLVIDLEGLEGASYMPLFVVLAEGVQLDSGLIQTIKRAIREGLSPRHVPDEIIAITEVPRTLNGKKLEVPIKKILRGIPLAQAANPDAMSNPHSLAFFVQFQQQRSSQTPS